VVGIEMCQYNVNFSTTKSSEQSQTCKSQNVVQVVKNVVIYSAFGVEQCFWPSY